MSKRVNSANELPAKQIQRAVVAPPTTDIVKEGLTVEVVAKLIDDALRAHAGIKKPIDNFMSNDDDNCHTPKSDAQPHCTSHQQPNPFERASVLLRSADRPNRKRQSEEAVGCLEECSADRHHKKSRPSLENDHEPVGRSYSRERDEPHTTRTTTTIARRIQQSRHDSAVTSPMPSFIIEQLSPPEVLILTRKLSPHKLTLRNCPSDIFARYYLKYGSQDVVLRYCQIEMEKKATSDQILEARRGGSPRSLSPNYDSDKERIERKSRVEREQLRLKAWHANEPWNQVVPKNRDGSFTLQHVFPEINETIAKHLLKDVPSFDPTHEDSARYDWCTWFDSIKSALSIHSLERAIFILLVKAGPKFTSEFITGVNHGIREMTLEVVMRRLGAVVYNKLGINPIELSTQKLRMKTFGITSYRDLYTRVVDLYHCRWDCIDEAKFVQELFHGIGFKLPKGDRPTFYNNVYMRYPSIKTVDYTDKGSQYYAASLMEYVPYTKPFPRGAKEIGEFENYLILMASSLTPSKVEHNFIHLCSDPEHRTFGTMSKQSVKFAEGTKGNNNNNQKSGSNDQQKGLARPAGVAAAAASKPSKSTNEGQNSNQSPARLTCSHCKRNGHVEDTCFILHPEIKDEVVAKSKLRRQERREAALKSNPIGSNNASSNPSQAKPKGKAKAKAKSKAASLSNNAAVNTSVHPPVCQSTTVNENDENDDPSGSDFQ